MENVFEVFKCVQRLTDSPEGVTLATYLTIGEFFDDGVKYIEIRNSEYLISSLPAGNFLKLLSNSVVNIVSKL